MAAQAVIHTPEELERIRMAAAVTAQVRDEIAAAVRPGMTTFDVDRLAGEFIRATGGVSAFLNYHGFPGNICISVNDEVVHGIGSPERIITENDVVSLDVGVRINGACGDTATTVSFGTPALEVRKLLEGTRKALEAGIGAARRGKHVRDISSAVEEVARRFGLGVVRDYVGHGCGVNLHEPPEVPNYTGWGSGPVLTPGMVLCIEPMFNIGTYRVTVDRDNGWTVRSKDGTYSAHFEHMVLITEKEPEILTWRKTM